MVCLKMAPLQNPRLNTDRIEFCFALSNIISIPNILGLFNFVSKRVLAILVFKIIFTNIGFLFLDINKNKRYQILKGIQAPSGHYSTNNISILQ